MAVAAVVVVAVGGFRGDAEESACPADFRNLLTAAESYFTQYDTTTIPAADATPNGYEQTLVNVGLVRQVSEWYDLDVNGDPVQVVGSPCTV